MIIITINRDLFDSARLKQGLTYDELARCINKSRATLSNKLNGKTEFTWPEIKMLIKVLKLSRQQFYDIFLPNE